MRVTVQKWGHSLALRIPKPFAVDAGVREGSTVEMSVSEGRLVAAPVQARPILLKDLLSEVTKANRHDEFDSGPAAGREAW
jgi:antitoxin MazE